MLVSLKVVIMIHCQASQKEGKNFLHRLYLTICKHVFFVINKEFSKKLKERVDDYFTANNIVSTV